MSSSPELRNASSRISVIFTGITTFSSLAHSKNALTGTLVQVTGRMTSPLTNDCSTHPPHVGMLVGDGVVAITSQFTTVFPGMNTFLLPHGVASKTLFASKDATPCGILMVLMRVPAKASVPIVSNWLLSSNSMTSSSEWRNARKRISVTPCGITIELMGVEWNEYWSIFSNWLPASNLMTSSFENANAAKRISVTPFGINTSLSSAQKLNASFGTLVQVAGRVTSPLRSGCSTHTPHTNAVFAKIAARAFVKLFIMIN